MKSKAARLVRRNHARYHQGRDDLNIVPMIDMMVILVFFLIFTAVFSKTNILQLNLPANASAAPLDLPKGLKLEVIIRPDDLVVNDRNSGPLKVLENTPNALSSAERLLLFLEVTHMDLNVCLDTGHANMNEGVDTAFRLLKSRIRSTHVHDNNGKDDSHLFPLADSTNGSGENDENRGTIDWKRTMTALRSLDPACPLLLELRELPEMTAPIQNARECFERLESIEPNE